MAAEVVLVVALLQGEQFEEFGQGGKNTTM